MEYKDLSIKEIVAGIKNKSFTCQHILDYFIKRCERYRDLNAVIEIYGNAMELAKKLDKKIAEGKSVGKLAGVPVLIKDNILYQGKKMSCASAFMKDFVAPYSATVVEKLLKEDAIIFGRTNMDEFAMGGSCENSIYGACHNAYDKSKVAGGSSGGSAVAVAAGLCSFAIGTDTGGSIRQPSSFNGVVGMKPTYGLVSRYGLVAFASSTDQAGPITKTVEDNKYVLEIISGKDSHDSTSIDAYFGSHRNGNPFKIGICKQLQEKIKGLSVYNKYMQIMDFLKKSGCEFVEIDVPHISNSLACYYILTPAEAASNLARFDGVKYTSRSASVKSLEEVYVKSRSEGFGKEVKRRIMLGNFVLSSGYFDAYYKKAKKLQALLKKEFDQAFESCDAIITPTTPGEAFDIGGKVSNPVSMYLEDLFTVPASLAGIPAISVPYANGDCGLPLGIQLMGAPKSEEKLYQIASIVEKGRTK